jgi:phage I-like protein
MKHLHKLSIAFHGDAPPTEFRIFRAGINETKKGNFLFDAKAAKLVIAEYKAHGIDLMIDYDHASLGADRAPDPAQAGKAAAWFCLELRGGELWAVNVRWTPPADAALRRKEWRFMSPAFPTDDEGRITALLNVALTNTPATRRLDPLVAASIGDDKTMHPDLIKQALDAIEAGDPKKAMELLKGMIADAAGAGPDADGDEPGSEGDGADGAGPPAAAAVEDPKVVDAADPNADPASDETDDEGKPAKKAAYKAMNVALHVLTGKKDVSDMLGEIEAWRTSHMTLATREKAIAKDRAILEADERRRLVVELVTLGAEFPSTVWADDKSTVIKPRWAKMPLVELKAHVADQRAARKAPAKKDGVKPPTAGPESTEKMVELSAEELKICESLKCDPKTYAQLKSMRDSTKDGN